MTAQRCDIENSPKDHRASDMESDPNYDSESDVESAPKADNTEDVERTPMLSMNPHGKPKVSTVRTRVVLFIVHLLMTSGGITNTILLAQYLVDRIGKDAGYDNVTAVDECSSNKSDPGTQQANEVQEQATDLLTYLSFVQTIPAIFVCFLVGSYSDYTGRRVVLLAPLLTAFLNAGIMSLVIGLHLDLNYLYLGCGLDGLSGSWAAIFVVEFAITADLSVSKDSRTLWIFLLLCSGGFVTSGVTLGTSYLIDSLGFFYASLVPTGLALVTFLVPLVLFQDTLIQKPTVRVWSPAFHFRRLFGLYVTESSRRRRATRLICMAIFIFASLSKMNMETLDSLYQLHEPFCWDARRIGQYFSIRAGGENLFGAIWLTLVRRCLPPEVIGMVGMVFGAFAYAFEAAITRSWQFYIVPALLVPAVPSVPIVRAMLSLLVSADQQGALFSSIAVVESLCSLAAGTVFTKVYSATVSSVPGAVFLLTAACGLTAFLFYIIYFIVREKPERKESNETLISKTSLRPSINT